MPTIIVPVYNAFSEALDCLRSVLEHSDGEHVIVVDDASAEGDFQAYCSHESVLGDSLSFFRNDHNLGFAGSCNRGIELAGDDDVILLNSDTIVTYGWVKKLTGAAYSRDNVGTVTPFTNNGAICSVPQFGVDNELPTNLSLEAFAHLVEEVSGSDYPELPTCVGFCTYIRREALNRCGAFRVESFPRGYGEENDLSLRYTEAGYCHLLDTTTFIYHSGSASFQEDKSELMEQGQKIIEKLYPHYADDIARFYVQNPLLPYQQRVQEALLKYWLESKEGVVLQILHNGPYVSRVDPLGGTERCVQGLIEDLPHLAHWSLVVSEAQYILSAHMGGYHREFYFPLAEISLRDIVSAELFPLVHVHHTRWFDQSHLAEALAEHPNVILSIHDFVLGCPRFHLITPEGEHCDTKSCSSVCGLSKSFMVSYRDAGQKLLSQASKAICFSDSSRRLLSKMFTLPESLEVVSHGISVTRNASYEVSRKEDEPLRVAVFGHLVAHKGEELFRKLFLHSKLPSASKVEWHLFGSEAPIQREHITSYGRYTPENLPEMVMQSGAHCALFLSRCPETYSLAVDEAWACGLPVVVSPLGAPRERVERSGAGWVVESLTEEVVLSLLDTIASNSQELMTKVSAVQKVNLLTRRDEAEQLSRHYKSSPRAGKDYEALLIRARHTSITPTAWKKIIGTGVNVCVRFLDSLRMRRKLEAVLYRIVPEWMLRRVKNVRRSAMLGS